MTTDARIIVALDYPQQQQAMDLVDKLKPDQCRLKVGKEMFTLFGPEFVKQIIAKGLSVREAERLAKKATSPEKDPKPAKSPTAEKDADTRALEDDLSATTLTFAVNVLSRAPSLVPFNSTL